MAGTACVSSRLGLAVVRCNGEHIFDTYLHLDIKIFRAPVFKRGYLNVII